MKAMMFPHSSGACRYEQDLILPPQNQYFWANRASKFNPKHQCNIKNLQLLPKAVGPSGDPSLDERH